MPISRELYDMLLEASKLMSPHQAAQLSTQLNSTVANSRAESKTRNPVLWGCPKCPAVHAAKSGITSHLIAGHKSKAETAAWLPVPLWEEPA